tara:strand:+ start:25471 stop:26097 length:627 start_codon:yes stop_codon:yes gene_type:complete
MAGIVQVADYTAMIATPAELGAGSSGSKITKNFSALGAFQGAFSGNTKAFKGMTSKNTSGLVGTRGFISVGGLCKDAATNESVPRYDYFNAATNGGLIGGFTNDINTMTSAVSSMTKGISGPAEPICSNPLLSVIRQDGIADSAAYHVPNTRLCSLDTSVFINPLDRQKICAAEGFMSKTLSDPLSKAYIGGVSILGLYIVMCVMSKE